MKSFILCLALLAGVLTFNCHNNIDSSYQFKTLCPYLYGQHNIVDIYMVDNSYANKLWAK